MKHPTKMNNGLLVLYANGMCSLSSTLPWTWE